MELRLNMGYLAFKVWADDYREDPSLRKLCEVYGT